MFVNAHRQRVDDKFLGPGGASVPEGQAILAGILEEAFELCQDLEVRQEEVATSLRPIYERLSGAFASVFSRRKTAAAKNGNRTKDKLADQASGD